ncbi:MAG: hypothetical protein UGE21_03170 [Lachnospiraceae bacterium]|nr:hypothetical protein [Lachnospiraceae bacterium]
MLYKKNQKVKQKENLPEEVNEMFEKPGKLKAGARQDSKSRNEQDSKSRKPLHKLQDSKGQNRDAKYLWKV